MHLTCFGTYNKYFQELENEVENLLWALSVTFLVGGSVIEQKSGFIGEDVLLPCNCSEDLKQLAWQRDLRMVTVYPEDKSNIDPSYMGRTQLFLKNEKKNCSLLLLNFSMEDEGVYTCFRIISVATGVSTMSPFKVNLTGEFESKFTCLFFFTEHISRLSLERKQQAASCCIASACFPFQVCLVVIY